MRLLPMCAAVAGSVLAALPPSLAAQCDCRPSRDPAGALAFGAEQMPWNDQFVSTAFTFRYTQLPRSGVGTDFTTSLTLAPYPFIIAEAGPALHLTYGPVSLLVRAGIGAVLIPGVPEGYAGLALLLGNDQVGVRLDATRRYFSFDGEWQPLQSIGISFVVVTPGRD